MMLNPCLTEHISSTRQNPSTSGQAHFEANELISRSPNTLLSRVFELDKDEHDKAHSHPWHQLLLPRSGMLRTRASGKVYFVPANRAVLVPAGTVHESWALTPARFAGIYLDPCLFPAPLVQCKIMEITKFLDSLVDEILELGQWWRESHEPEQLRLISVFIDRLNGSPEIDLSLTLPDDKRLLPIARELLTRSASRKSLSEWSKSVGASERTISRQFRKLTGLSFAQWRQKARMINALSMLEQGASIQETAFSVGYSSASAFIHSFRQEFGTTPQRYYLRGAGMLRDINRN